MYDLIELLNRFNRKERFFLVGDVLGNRDFSPSKDFLGRLSKATGIPIPPGAFTAIDYHLDWIAASLACHQSAGFGPFNNADGVFRGIQEDIDLLVAFEENKVCHLVLVEAKAYTGWTNKQMLSKAGRLEQIFGDDGNRYAGVRPHFCMASPKEPERLGTSAWPGWMSNRGVPQWLKLCLPNDRLKVTRCDTGGPTSDSGDQFSVHPSPGGRRWNSY